jgi:serine/threonine-protein kinase
MRSHEAGIVHRDLKPDNVFLVRGDEEEIAKVLDFGIAKTSSHSLEPSSVTRTGAVMGTPYYMSPEQISGAKGVDYRTDLWALGVIACQCLTGKLPFEADTMGGLVLAICAQPIPSPSQLGPSPPAFDVWFERAMARVPEQRFQSARELAEQLRRVCGFEPSAQAPEPADATPLLVNAVSAFSVSNTSAGPPLRRSGKLGRLLVAGLGLVACVGLAFWVFERSRALSNAGNLDTAPPLTAKVAPQTPAPPTVATQPPESPVPVTPSQQAVLAAPQPAPRATVSATAVPTRARPASRPAAHPAPGPAAVAPTKSKPDLDSSVFDRRKG